MNKLTILGVFFDGYKDLWPDFINLFKRHWPDCPFELFIVSNVDESYDIDGIKVLSAGHDAEYSRKIQYALKNIDSDYYLVLLEDFFFSQRVDTNLFFSLLKYIEDNQIRYYAMPMVGFLHNYKGKKNSNRPGERFLSERAEYTLNCQPSIWKREYLTECIGTENYNAWVFEGLFSKINVRYKSLFVDKCIVNLTNPLSIVHGVVQGKFIQSSYKTLSNDGYFFDSNRMMATRKESCKRFLKVNIRRLLPYSFRRAIKKIFKPKSVMKSYEDTITSIIKARWGEEAC